MADRVILLRRGDEQRAHELIGEFAKRTGLVPNDIEGGTEFPIGPSDHDIEIVQTLNEIDREWSDHLALGDPGAESSG